MAANMNRAHKLTGILMLFPLFLFFLFFLSGCSSMNSLFDCPHKPGVMCRSLDQVNDMVDREVFGNKASIPKVKTPKFSFLGSNTSSVGTVKQSIKKPLRIGEQVVKIWIAPYQDVQGNYHNESEIYTVVNKNQWAVPKEIDGANFNVR